MKRILVPTDFSATAEKALLFAIDLAKKAGSSIMLYHVYTPVESVFIESFAERKLHNENMQLEVMRQMHGLVETLNPNNEVAIASIVGKVPLLENVVRFAEKNHADLIVMGTQGASGIKKSLIGTVAARMIEASRIPILLIPEQYNGSRIQSAVFATSYHPSDIDALTATLGIANVLGASTTIVRIGLPGEESKEQQDFESYATHVKEHFDPIPLQFRLVSGHDIQTTMEELYDHIPYDMLAMVRRKKSFLESFFLESFTEHMSYVTRQPLLVVPENEETL
ncbi:MAG: universal stress protein [Hydrotalea sp.]|nr:universal stress protein [Hydrotalea sp.]